MVVISNDGRQLMACNHAFLMLTGYSRTDIETLNPLALFPVSDADRGDLVDRPAEHVPPAETRGQPRLGHVDRGTA